MTNKIFISIAAGFLSGIFVSSFVQVSPTVAFLVAVVAAAFIAVCSVGLFPKKLFLLLAIALLAFSVGALRFYTKDFAANNHILDNFLDENVTVTGVINEEVEHRQNSQRLIVRAEKIEYLGEEYPVSTKILVSTELFPELVFGERIKINGKIEKPENFITDIGKEFDYVNYLRKDNIYYTLSFANVEVVGVGKVNPIKSEILKIKSKFLGAIDVQIPAPESSLLSGLLLGVKESLGPDLEQAFVDTGLVHIIVLSGYNVTIIADAIIKTLSFLSVTAGIYLGGLAIAIFVIMTGAGATIVRAGIMAILALVARATGRPYEITRALILAAIIMVAVNPYILVFDISFQLSFLATIGLIFLSPVFANFFRFIPKTLGLREIVSATLATQVFVLPFILYKIGNLSLIAPLTNVLVLPTVPATMLFGFLSGTFGFISHFLAAPFGFIAYLLLKYQISVVQFFAGLSFSSLEISRFPAVLTFAFYAGVFWLLGKSKLKFKNKDENRNQNS